MSSIEVLFFGQLAEQTNSNSITLNGHDDIESVKKDLIYRYPILANQHFQIALDKEIIYENVTLSGNHIIALLPPYAGG